LKASLANAASSSFFVWIEDEAAFAKEAFKRLGDSLIYLWEYSE
jgi:hypothetical protein